MTRGAVNRRFFAARAEVADAFVRMAARKNLTLYGLLSDILEKVVDLDNLGVPLNEAIHGFQLCRTAKEIGYAFVPESLWYNAAEVSLKSNREQTEKRFAEAGEWIGKYVLAKSRGTDPTKYMVSCLEPLGCDATELSIDANDRIHIRCVNPRHSLSYAESFSTLLRRAIETLGYVCENKTVSRGMVLLSLRRDPQLERKMRGEILA